MLSKKLMETPAGDEDKYRAAKPELTRKSISAQKSQQEEKKKKTHLQRRGVYGTIGSGADRFWGGACEIVLVSTSHGRSKVRYVTFWDNRLRMSGRVISSKGDITLRPYK